MSATGGSGISNLVPQKGLVPVGGFNPMMQSGTLKSNGQGGFNLSPGATPTPIVPKTQSTSALTPNGNGGFNISSLGASQLPQGNNTINGIGSGTYSGIIPPPQTGNVGGGAGGMGGTGNGGTSAPVNPGSNGTATGVPITVYNKDGTTSTFNTGTPGDAAKAQAAIAAGGSTQAPQTNPLTPNNNSFGGAVGTVMQTAASPTGNFSTAQNTANTSAQSLLDSTPAQNAAVVAAKQNIQDLQNAYADQTGLIGNSPIGLSEQGGEQGLLNSQYASKLGAAQTALASVLQGNAQQQAAYTGAGNIANTEAGAATTQQQAQLGAQEAAAGLVAPTPANIYGMYQPDKGLVQGYNSGTAENPSTGGVATGGAIQTQAQQGSAVQTMTGTLTQAQGLASTLSDAITSAGYNPVQGIGPATTFANGVNDWLQKNSGSPQYQNVANLISEVANKYAAILNQSGGTPTSVSQVQQQIINGLASGTQIKDILANLDTNAQTSINALKSASQTNAAQGSSGGSSETTKVINGRTYTKTANGWTSS